jgi:hypothetical protein
MTRENTMKDKYGKDVYKKWGSKGGSVKTKKGTATLSKEQRVKRSKEAANARWSKVKMSAEDQIKEEIMNV